MAVLLTATDSAESDGERISINRRHLIRLDSYSKWSGLLLHQTGQAAALRQLATVSCDGVECSEMSVQ